MIKKILLVAASMLVGINPLLSTVKADSNGWSPVPASGAWSYGTHRVERLALNTHTVGPLSFGDAVIVAEPPAYCYGNACEQMTLSLFRNGVRIQADGVPLSALNVDRYVKNGNRFLYAKAIAEGVFALYEWDLKTGVVNTLVAKVNVPGATTVDVQVDNRGTYFLSADTRFSNANIAFTQRALYLYDVQERAARPLVGKTNPTDRRTELLDVKDGVAFVKMVFADKSSELWLLDSNRVNYDDGHMVQIPATWTDASGDAQYGRMLSSDSIEYFQHFVRYTWQIGDNKPAKRGELLSWYRPVANAVKTDGKNLAWLTADDEVYLNDGVTVSKIGVATNGAFTLDNGKLFYGAKAFDIASKTVIDAPFAVAEAAGLALAGIDDKANVYFGSIAKSVRVGFGTLPAVSDAQHLYWRGVDGDIYVATLKPSAPANINRALRVTGTKTVYLVTADGTRHAIPNERVFLSYFKNWSSMETVSQTEMDRYPLGAAAAFPVGTLLKRVGDTKIYAIAKDGTVRHIRSAEAGYGLFGETWYARIISASEVDFVPYASGSDIYSTLDGANLF